MYQCAKRGLARPGEASEPLERRVAAGALAGCTAWSSIYPVDVLRSRIMAGAGRGGGGDGGARGGGEAGGGVVRAEAVRLYRSGGARAFYRGIGATLLRAGPVAGVLLPVNDLALEALSRRYAEQG